MRSRSDAARSKSSARSTFCCPTLSTTSPGIRLEPSVGASPRSEHTCPGESSKTWRLLEAARGDIEFSKGQFAVKGTDRRIGIFEVAKAAATNPRLPEHLRGKPVLSAAQIEDVIAYLLTLR